MISYNNFVYTVYTDTRVQIYVHVHTCTCTCMCMYMYKYIHVYNNCMYTKLVCRYKIRKCLSLALDNNDFVLITGCCLCNMPIYTMMLLHVWTEPGWVVRVTEYYLHVFPMINVLSIHMYMYMEYMYMYIHVHVHTCIYMYKYMCMYMYYCMYT